MCHVISKIDDWGGQDVCRKPSSVRGGERADTAVVLRRLESFRQAILLLQYTWLLLFGGPGAAAATPVQPLLRLTTPSSRLPTARARPGYITGTRLANIIIKLYVSYLLPSQRLTLPSGPVRSLV